MSPIVEVKNLSFGYAQQMILNQLSFDVDEGTFLAIAGPNGAGKTTLLNLFCGLLEPAGGYVKINSKNVGSYSVKKLAQKVSVVRQEFVPGFDFTAEETVSMARTPYLPVFGFEGETDRELVREAMAMTDIERFASRRLAQLSAGERQRVFIARALAQNSPILLLDEPTTFLDLKHQVDIYDLLKTAQQKKGKTIIAVTHDINMASQYCEQALLLGADSKYVIGKTRDVFSSEHIEKVFAVRTFAGTIGHEKFFIPLGKFAKDTARITDKPEQ